MNCTFSLGERVEFVAERSIIIDRLVETLGSVGPFTITDLIDGDYGSVISADVPATTTTKQVLLRVNNWDINIHPRWFKRASN